MQHKVCTLSVVYLYNFRGNVLYETQHSLSQTDCTKNRIFWSIVVDKFTQLFSAPVGVIEMKFSQVPSQQQSRNPHKVATARRSVQSFWHNTRGCDRHMDGRTETPMLQQYRALCAVVLCRHAITYIVMYQLLLINPRDGIVLWTELNDDCDKLAVDRRRHCQLT